MLKRFKIIADKYWNRRKRFGLRFNLIAGLYNWELHKWVPKEVYFMKAVKGGLLKAKSEMIKITA